jgi:hypothetical protein
MLSLRIAFVLLISCGAPTAFGRIGETADQIRWARGPITVRLELPIAREYEAELKAAKEQKARSSVPQF